MIGFSLGVRGKRLDIFPIFSWTLFSKVRETRTDYTIVIHQHNGQVFNPGIPMEKLSPSMIKSKNSMVNTALKNMADAYFKNNQEELTKYRNIFEKNFLKGQIEYELLQEKYFLLNRYRTAETAEIKQTSLGFFRNYKMDCISPTASSNLGIFSNSFSC